jgi:hypothetical protein
MYGRFDEMGRGILNASLAVSVIIWNSKIRLLEELQIIQDSLQPSM